MSERKPSEIRSSETIAFEHGSLDTHAAYNSETDRYTIVADGIYYISFDHATVVKASLTAGNWIEKVKFIRRSHE